MKQFFAFCVFAFSFASVFATSFGPGDCPKPTQLAQPFNLEQYVGTWYEIKSTKPIFEAGLRCIKANYELVVTTAEAIVLVNNTGVSLSNSTVFSVGVAVPSEQDNVLAVKFFQYSPYAQYWIVDTDYTGYALVVSCNNVYGLFNARDAFILSRNPTLDEGIVKNLETKLDSVGITGAYFIDTIQDC